MAWAWVPGGALAGGAMTSSKGHQLELNQGPMPTRALRLQNASQVMRTQRSVQGLSRHASGGSETTCTIETIMWLLFNSHDSVTPYLEAQTCVQLLCQKPNESGFRLCHALYLLISLFVFLSLFGSSSDRRFLRVG